MERTTSESDRGRSSSKRQDSADREGGPPGGGSGSVATLHGAVGNQAVKELHERGEIQAKLDVSQPTDASEREAERVADEVVGMGDSGDGTDRNPAVTRKATGSSGGTVDGETESRIESVTGGGRPLPESTRSFFEQRFGRDFSDVRVHTGPDADEAARSINAEAFTYGSDVVFRSDAYRPGSQDGRQLLAHELAHVVQQGGSGVERVNSMNTSGTVGRETIQRRLPDNTSGYSQRDAERDTESRNLSNEEVGQMLVSAGIADPHVVESILSTASNIETVLGTAVDIAGLFGLEAGAAYSVGGSLTVAGTASAALTASGPLLFGIGAVIAWANALQTDETVASAVSGAYATVAIAKGRSVPVDPVTRGADFSSHASVWNQASERVERQYRNMFSDRTRTAENYCSR